MSNGQLLISICDVTTSVPGDQRHGKIFKILKYHFIEMKIKNVHFPKVGPNQKRLLLTKFDLISVSKKKIIQS